MIESSHKQENWFSLGETTKSVSGTGFFIKDMIVRWNEQIQTITEPEGDKIEYVYDALRFDLDLPLEVQPGIESVEYYVEQAKSAILLRAQVFLEQEVGFFVD